MFRILQHPLADAGTSSWKRPSPHQTNWYRLRFHLQFSHNTSCGGRGTTKHRFSIAARLQGFQASFSYGWQSCSEISKSARNRWLSVHAKHCRADLKVLVFQTLSKDCWWGILFFYFLKVLCLCSLLNILLRYIKLVNFVTKVKYKLFKFLSVILSIRLIFF